MRSALLVVGIAIIGLLATLAIVFPEYGKPQVVVPSVMCSVLAVTITLLVVTDHYNRLAERVDQLEGAVSSIVDYLKDEDDDHESQEPSYLLPFSDN